MARFERSGLFAAAAFSAALLASAAQAADGEIKVIDGDSLVVGEQAYRLFGIDAPEPGQECTINENRFDCGMVAGTALMDLTAGSKVHCREVDGPEADLSHEDRGESEQLAVCFADGYDLSEGMVYTGWALALPESAQKYLPFENQARDKRHGLWKGSFSEPWSWRKKQAQ